MWEIANIFKISKYSVENNFRHFSVDHNKLWKIRKEMGIADHLICLFRNLYAGQEATVRPELFLIMDMRLGNIVLFLNVMERYRVTWEVGIITHANFKSFVELSKGLNGK